MEKTKQLPYYHRLPEDLILPEIHMNGTGKEMLQRDYDNAYHDVCNAIDAIAKVEFNARDYYTISPDAFEQARQQRRDMIYDLLTVKDYLEAHLNHISNS